MQNSQVEKQGVINQVKEEHAPNEDGVVFSWKEQLLATAMVLLSALSGALLGAIFSFTKTSDEVVSWVALPGDLFIRALKCVILPLVFVNIILSMIQMAEAGKAAAVGYYTVTIYMFTTMVAAIEGLIIVQFFKQYFSAKTVETDPTFVHFLCPTEGFVLIQDGHTLSCKNLTDSDFNQSSSEFEVVDVNEFFETNDGTYDTLSFSETIQENIFKTMVPENIFGEFVNFSFVGVITFCVVFGAASFKVNSKPVIIIQILEEINDILTKLISWIILCTPVAVFSLITGALASQEDLESTMKDIGVLLAATICGDIIHFFVVLPGLLYYCSRKNPFSYMKFLIPAQMFAFSCASSAATLPVNMKCVKASGQVPDSIRDFVLPVGATVNMDGVALYFPPALIYLANSAQLETGIPEYFLIIIVATLGSIGTAPVPNGSILLLLTAYTTVYGQDVPDAFAILFGVQWLIDRCQVILNVTGDAMVARMITSLAHAEVVPDRPTSMMEVEAHSPVI